MANGQFFSGLVRLYHASFDRESDMPGIGHWARQLAQGEIVFAEVAAAFMASEEFAARYPEGLDDEAFVALLYHNVLQREPDAEGLAYWLRVLDEGNLRSQVLVSFADSDEFIAGSGDEFADELAEAEQVERAVQAELESEGDDSGDVHSDDTDYQDFVENLYDAAFNRPADAQGLGYWVSQLAQNKLDLSAVAEAFMASDEFGEIYGHGLADDVFITVLYHNVLGRDPDTDGQAYWLGQLVAGLARHDVLEAFANSVENSQDDTVDTELVVLGSIDAGETLG